MVLEKTLESPLDSKEIQPVHPKGNPEHSLEALMLKLKLQYFGHMMRRTDLLEKGLMLGKIEGREEKGTTEDEMAGWHHGPKGYECEQTLGDSEEQGSLTCFATMGLQRVRHN